MDKLLIEAQKLELICNEGTPKELLGQLYRNCYMLPEEFKRKSPLVEIEKVCQTQSILLKDIILRLLTDLSSRDEM